MTCLMLKLVLYSMPVAEGLYVVAKSTTALATIGAPAIRGDSFALRSATVVEETIPTVPFVPHHILSDSLGLLFPK